MRDCFLRAVSCVTFPRTAMQHKQVVTHSLQPAQRPRAHSSAHLNTMQSKRANKRAPTLCLKWQRIEGSEAGRRESGWPARARECEREHATLIECNLLFHLRALLACRAQQLMSAFAPARRKTRQVARASDPRGWPTLAVAASQNKRAVADGGDDGDHHRHHDRQRSI